MEDTRIAAIDERLGERLQQYKKWCSGSQYCYYILSVSQVVLAALIPFIILLWPNANRSTQAGLGAIVVAGIGSLLTVLKGLDGVFKPQETWIRQDQTIMRLRGEELLFQTNAPPYIHQQSDNIALYAQNINCILSSENTLWTRTFRENGDNVDLSSSLKMRSSIS